MMRTGLLLFATLLLPACGEHPRVGPAETARDAALRDKAAAEALATERGAELASLRAELRDTQARLEKTERLLSQAVELAKESADSARDARTRAETLSAEISAAKPVSRTTEAGTPKQSPTGSWAEVARWTGKGPKKTETFSIPSREWRVRWRSWGEPFTGAGMVSAFVYTEGGDMKDLAVNHQGAGKDQTHLRGGPGRFYLDVNAANCEWEIIVESQR